MPSTWMVVTKEFMESHGLWVMLLSTIAMGQLLGTILGSFYTISTMSLDREIKLNLYFGQHNLTRPPLLPLHP